MKSANGPSSLHSPFSAPGLEVAVAVALTALVVATVRIEEVIDRGVVGDAVEESMSLIKAQGKGFG